MKLKMFHDSILGPAYIYYGNKGVISNRSILKLMLYGGQCHHNNIICETIAAGIM
jgi:hypothetical protein